MASITSNLIQDVQIGSNDPARIAASAYGVCNSLASDTTKIVEMTGFVIMTGVTINVKFTNKNTATSPLLNVQTSGAYPIMQYGSTNAGVDELTTSWPAGAIVSFTFDGTNWVMNYGVNTNTTYNIQHTYSDTDENPISGKGVKAAIETLDIPTINNTAGKTVETITEQDGKVGATFQDIQIGEAQVTNLTNDLAAKAPINNPTFTGTVTVPAINSLSGDTEAATKKYVDDTTAGLTGILHYIDAPDVTFTVDYGTPSNPNTVVTIGGTLPTGYTPAKGDVILYNKQEFIYTGSIWRLLGDEGSYALKTNTASVVESFTLSQTLPSLTRTNEYNIPNVTGVGTTPSLTHTEFNIGSVTGNSSPTQAVVENGTLKITIGTASTSETKQVSNISNWNAGTTPTLGAAFTGRLVTDWNAGVAVNANPTMVTVVKP